MPIIHIHSPGETVALSPGHIADRELIIDALRMQGAQATIRKPDSVAVITPPALQDMLPGEIGIWLSVDETGDLAEVTYTTGRGVVPPTSIVLNIREDGIGMTRDPAPSKCLIGPDYAKNLTISTDTGRNLTAETVVGSMVVYRTLEETAALMEIFQQQSPEV